MSKLIIWDIDGTILDCKGCGRKALSLTFERLYGHQDAFVDVDLTGKIDIEVISEIVSHHDIPLFDLNIFMGHYGEVLNEVMGRTEGIDLLPGVEDILKYFSNKKDYYFSIATGNCKTGAMGKLKYCQVNHFFETGAYGDEAHNRAKLIEMAIENAKSFYGQVFEKKSIFYLGDTPKDIEAAKANGIQSVAVSTGYYTHEALKNHLPNYLLKDMQNMKQVNKIFEIGR
jgi:phosphoglycolate phosphatase-like HAD superfamily hydrolase